ncbi:SRPBCC family protein [Nocardioides humilatus]|uniref:SRPBCC family protein n=1 Tax=Nocardioides humilatus TaxID=2607660 RepID=A0A5B1LC84_9ACTN|nr:SRPBCC family protein [Nocardioides humilatus]KAA1417177.1 SRPBCC family protein [Nocardioides humilatus]
MRDLRDVDADFVETAPFSFANSVDLAITPDQLFEVFLNAEAWPQWVKALTQVTWTSPQPFGPGTTRTVHLRGGIVGDEEFFTWDAPRQIAFRFIASSSRLTTAFSERYDVEPTADGCRLTWSVGIDVPRALAPVVRLTHPLLDRLLASFLTHLRHYTDKHYSAN